VGVDCTWNDENKRYKVLLLKQLGGAGSKIMSMLNCFELTILDFSIIFVILKEGSYNITKVKEVSENVV